MFAKPIDTEVARELLKYDQETGVLTWRVARGRMPAGAVAGSPNKDGYLVVQINGSRHLAHRIAVAIQEGDADPDVEIDHKNGVTADNRWENLRKLAPIHNMQNQTKISKRNTSGVRGVRFRQDKGRFLAFISVRSTSKHLGYHDTIEEAMAARLVAERLYHPFAPSNQRSTIEVTF